MFIDYSPSGRADSRSASLESSYEPAIGVYLRHLNASHTRMFYVFNTNH
jgi:hypothetical protein